MRPDIIYMQVMIQLYLIGWDKRRLAQEAQIPYTSLLRKLRGVSPLHLDEAKKIQKALNCGMSLDELFSKRGEVQA